MIQLLVNARASVVFHLSTFMMYILTVLRDTDAGLLRVAAHRVGGETADGV